MAYKILALDGGGTWALLQVLTLETIFKKKYPSKEVKGHEVLRHFDLVIANSGGSMVLAALSCNWSFTEIKSIFDDQNTRNSIFKKLSFRDKYFPVNLLGLIGVKSVGTRYSTTNKRAALNELLKINGEKKLDSVLLSELPDIIGKPSLQLIVTTFDIINKRAKLFRSFRDSKARAEVISGVNEFDEISLVEAIHGSSNAPVNYFDFPAIFSPAGSKKRFYLWDGALGGFNNPILAGVTEALANGVKRDDIHVLSIGTASKLVSDEDSEAFLTSYYSTLLGKKIKKDKKTGAIDFDRTKHWYTWFGRIKKPKLLFRLFRGSDFFSDTIANLSKSILMEPQTWATYGAYVNLFSNNIDDEDNKKRCVRLSPQLNVDRSSSTNLLKLYALDMDITEQGDIDLLKWCFSEWKDGQINNEPIQWTKTINDTYVFAKGHQTFEAALNDLDWL